MESRHHDSNTELILMDSNSAHINRNIFWRLDKTKWTRCGVIAEAAKVVEETLYENLQYVLLSIGVNDTDEEDGVTVGKRLEQLIKTIKQKYPTTKIILNELTPRKGPRDKEVIDCNRVLLQVASSDNSIFLAKQSNLRDAEYSFHFDEKHIKSSKIGRYVGNIKLALRKAYGITNFQPNLSRGMNNYHNNQQQLEQSLIPSNYKALDNSVMKRSANGDLNHELMRHLLTLLQNK